MRPRFEAQGHGDAVTARVPRRFAHVSAGVRRRSACLFDPEFTPAFRAYLAVDERAGVQQRRGGRHHIPT